MNWFQRIPKVELHLHLEGAIPLPALWTLIQKHGGDPSVPNLQALREKLKYRDFPHFLQTWRWKDQFLRDYDDFTYIAEHVARDLAQQNIRYAEVSYCPYIFAMHNLQVTRATEAIRLGLSRVPQIDIALIADSPRDLGPEAANALLDELKQVTDLGVIGLGLGGSEHEFPPEPFADVYEKARQLGFRTTAHAGEAAGPASIWGAIKTLRVDRIGHGTRAEEDEALLDYLAQHRIPLEMCPLSNLRTGVVPSIEQHPIRRYFDLGLLVTVNTDDPKMFHNSLAEELTILHENLAFTHDEIRQLILNAIEAAWLPPNRKQQLTNTFAADPAWQNLTP